MSTGLLLTNATFPDGRQRDLVIEQGVIADIRSPGYPAPPAAKTLDLGGDLICPGLVEGHCHLDKTYMGLPWIPNETGPEIAERIAYERQMERSITYPVVERASALIELLISKGSTTIRTHVDIDLTDKLERLHGVLEARQRYQDQVTIQIVAFPQTGVICQPGVLDLMDGAIQAGADVIGGIDPATLDGDVNGQLDGIFNLADKHGVGLDLHLHNQGTLGIFELEQVAIRAKSLGMAGRVVCSHSMSLGTVSPDLTQRTAERLGEAGVAVMTYGPGTIPLPPIKTLLEAGVTIFGGSDNIRDAWSPYGSGDMLERAMLLAYRSGFRRDQDLNLAFDLVTTYGAKGLGLSDYGLHIGAPADLVVLPVSSIPEAIVTRPPRRWVLKRGTIVVEDGIFRQNASVSTSDRGVSG